MAHANAAGIEDRRRRLIARRDRIIAFAIVILLAIGWLLQAFQHS